MNDGNMRKRKIFALCIDTEQTTSEQLKFITVFYEVTTTALATMLSLTVSFEMFSSVLLMSHQSNDQHDKASLALISPFMNFIYLLGMGPLYSVPVILSRLAGEYNTKLDNHLEEDNHKQIILLKKQIADIHKAGFILAMLASIPMSICFIFSEFVLYNIARQNKSTALSAQNFLRPYTPALVGAEIRMITEQVLFVFNKQKFAMYCGGSFFLFGTALAILFGFNTLNINKLNNRSGVAFSYALTSLISAAIYMAKIAYDKELASFEFLHLFSNTDNLAQLIQTILVESAPMIFNMLNDALFMMVIGALSAFPGIETQAAMSYMFQLIFMLMLPVIALGITIQIHLGKKFGAKEFSQAHDFANYSLLTTVLCISPLLILVMAYPKLLNLVLGETNSETTHTISTLATIMPIGFLSDTVRTTMLIQCRAIKPSRSLWNVTLKSSLGLWAGLLGSLLTDNVLLNNKFDATSLATAYLTGTTCGLMLITQEWLTSTSETGLRLLSENHSSLYACLPNPADSEQDRYSPTRPLLGDGTV